MIVEKFEIFIRTKSVRENGSKVKTKIRNEKLEKVKSKRKRQTEYLVTNKSEEKPK
jgi:hypothetical protein